MQTRIKWDKKATDFVVAQHTANKLNKKVLENSVDVLTLIGAAVATHVEHKGIIPTAASVRSKLTTCLDSEGVKVYVAKTTATQPSAAGDAKAQSKAGKVDVLRTQLGIDKSVNTLANSNATDLDEVIKSVIQLKSLSILSATKEQLEDALECLHDAEQDAIADGVSVEDLNQVEESAADLVTTAIAGDDSKIAE